MLVLPTMTKVQIHLWLQRPLDDEMMKKIRDANSIYGIEHIKILPSLTELMVEYDATRLSRPTILQLLRTTGIAVVEELPLIPPQEAAPAAPAPVRQV